MKVYYVGQELKQGINTKTMCHTTYLKSHLLQVYLGVLAKIEIVIQTHVC